MLSGRIVREEEAIELVGDNENPDWIDRSRDTNYITAYHQRLVARLTS